jgi:hypothetical protein
MPFLKLKKAFVFLIFLLIVFDLFRFGFKYTPFTDGHYLYPETNLTNFLKEQPGLFRFIRIIPQSMFIPYDLSSPEGYEPLMMKRYAQFANQINEEKFNQVSTGSRWVIVNRHESPLLNLMGTKYLLSYYPEFESDWEPQYFQYPEKKYELIFQYGDSQIYENKQALPRAFLVHDYQVLEDKEILKTLMKDDFDYQEVLLLEEEPQVLPEEKLGEESVLINEETYFDNQILIETQSNADGFLFVSDNHYPGWRAFVNDQETKLYRANYTFRAVFVPKGEHQVKFIYEPSSHSFVYYL